VDVRLREARYYWLATVRPDGRPHATPLWGAWIGGALYFDGAPITRWGRNVTANPQATVHLERGDDVVILEGIMEDVVTDPETGDRIVEMWHAKYGEFAPQPATDGIFRFRPQSVRAWSTATLETGTRWRFTVG
jgi:hypothetical protein